MFFPSLPARGRLSDVGRLGAFVSSAEQNYNHIALSTVVNTVSWSDIDPEFADAAEILVVAEITAFDLVNLASYPRSRTLSFTLSRNTSTGDVPSARINLSTRRGTAITVYCNSQVTFLSRGREYDNFTIDTGAVTMLLRCRALLNFTSISLNSYIYRHPLDKLHRVL